MSVFNNLFCDFYIFLKGMFGTIIHDRRKSTINAGFADFERGTMIQVEAGWDFRIVLKGNFNKPYNIFLPGIFPGSFGSLENDRGFFSFCGFHNPLNDFHVIDIKSTDSIMAFIGLFKHFSCSNERHIHTFLS